MKLRHAMVSLALVLAAGCDTMEQDIDGKTLSINNDPAYFLPGSGGYIDLGARILSPGKVRVEITGPTSNGELKDLGKGLLQYSPFKGSTAKDSFRFRVFSDDNRVLGEDTIGIIIPSDTSKLPCAVYARNDSAKNVTGPVTVDVLANDYSCSMPLSVSINVAPTYGTASVVGNKIVYTPGTSFKGHDAILYKATTSDPSMLPGYALLRIVGIDSVLIDPACITRPKNDLFYKAFNDSSLMWLNVLANDSICGDSTITITQQPRFGTAFVYNQIRKISYRNSITMNFDDTLVYRVGGLGNSVARVIIKRQ
jgi:hypothetical protein